MNTNRSRIALRPMTIHDVPAVLAAQEPAEVVGLAAVFPQDQFPYPRESVARRWVEEIGSAEITTFVVVDPEGAVIGYAAIRDDEFTHFGIAIDHWGTGAAQDAHDAVLEAMALTGVSRAWLRVLTGNHRGRRFYERLGWTPTGLRSECEYPPFAELLHYQLRLPA